MLRRTCLGLLCVTFVGCGQEPAKETGVKIQAPGVNINVDPQKGVDIQAPGTSIKVGDGKAEIKAPGTELKVNP